MFLFVHTEYVYFKVKKVNIHVFQKWTTPIRKAYLMSTSSQQSIKSTPP